MFLFVQIKTTNQVISKHLNQIASSIVLSVKDAIAFVTGYIKNGFTSIVTILALNPLLFVEQRRYATVEAISELASFFDRGFKHDISEQQIIKLVEHT